MQFLLRPETNELPSQASAHSDSHAIFGGTVPRVTSDTHTLRNGSPEAAAAGRGAAQEPEAEQSLESRRSWYLPRLKAPKLLRPLSTQRKVSFLLRMATKAASQSCIHPFSEAMCGDVQSDVSFATVAHNQSSCSPARYASQVLQRPQG